jgi:3-dehydroquinate synthase
VQGRPLQLTAASVRLHRLVGRCYNAFMTSSKRALVVLACALLIPILPFAAIGELPGERWLNAAGGDQLRFGLTGAALLTLDVLLPIPSSIIGALLGGRLGFGAGFIWSFFGLAAGHALGYALGRLVPERWSSQLPAAPSWIAILLSRPVPVFAEALAIAAGAERMPLAAFASSAALGDAIYAGVLAANGATLLPDGMWGVGLAVPLLLPVLGYLAFRKLHAPSARGL